MSGTTTPERLARIETLLETKLDEIAARLDKIEKHQTKQDTDAATDRADLLALKNKGTGLLIGAAIAGGAGWEAVKALVGSVLK
jgi:hypothetical protein